MPRPAISPYPDPDLMARAARGRVPLRRYALIRHFCHSPLAIPYRLSRPLTRISMFAIHNPVLVITPSGNARRPKNVKPSPPNHGILDILGTLVFSAQPRFREISAARTTARFRNPETAPPRTAGLDRPISVPPSRRRTKPAVETITAPMIQAFHDGACAKARIPATIVRIAPGRISRLPLPLNEQCCAN